MPHKCLRCHKVYPNDANEILKGCSNCSNKSFLYIREEFKEENIEIPKEKKEQILKQIESNFNEYKDKPIIIEVGSINVKEVGKYEIDINKLMKRDDEKVPIYKVGDGTFLIDMNYLNE